MTSSQVHVKEFNPVSLTVGEIKLIFSFHGPPIPIGQRPYSFDKGQSLPVK